MRSRRTQRFTRNMGGHLATSDPVPEVSYINGLVVAEMSAIGRGVLKAKMENLDDGATRIVRKRLKWDRNEPTKWTAFFVGA